MHFDIKEIVSAWASKLNPTEEQKKLAEKRAAICNECSDVGTAIEGSEGTRYCKHCGCFLEAKVYSYKEGACPIGKWDKADAEFKGTSAIKVSKSEKKRIL